MTALSSGRWNTRGRGLPGCGFGVTLPISTQANPRSNSPVAVDCERCNRLSRRTHHLQPHRPCRNRLLGRPGWRALYPISTPYFERCFSSKPGSIPLLVTTRRLAFGPTAQVHFSAPPAPPCVSFLHPRGLLIMVVPHSDVSLTANPHNKSRRE